MRLNKFYERTFHCWNEYGHGKINLEQAIVQSCDVYFYNVIQKINLNDLAEYAKRFGFGLVTNIDLPAEMKGRMPNRQFMNKIHGRGGWSLGALLNISIGQGEILVTPLQMVSYINVLFSIDELFEPYKLYLKKSVSSFISHLNTSKVSI